MMIARRLTALVIFLSAFLGLGILSFLGNRWLSAVFIVAAGTVVARHAASICPRCSNIYCGFNPHRATKEPAEGGPGIPGCAGEFSNLPITKTTVAPLLVTGPFAALGAWLFSPIATVVLFAMGFLDPARLALPAGLRWGGLSAFILGVILAVGGMWQLKGLETSTTW